MQAHPNCFAFLEMNREVTCIILTSADIFSSRVIAMAVLVIIFSYSREMKRCVSQSPLKYPCEFTFFLKKILLDHGAVHESLGNG